MLSCLQTILNFSDTKFVHVSDIFLLDSPVLWKNFLTYLYQVISEPQHFLNQQELVVVTSSGLGL